LKQITHGARDVLPACTPDGKWIAYNSQTADGRWRTLKIAADGGGDPIELRPPHGGNGRPLAISPDGKSFAQTGIAGEGANRRVHLEVFDLETGKKTYDFSPANLIFNTAGWTPDGRSVTYVGCVDHNCQLFMQPLSGGEPVQLTHFDSEPLKIPAYAWSRDGKKFAITRQRARDTDVVMLSNFR
jgi:Tol biopolymer transport system component